MVSLLGGFLIFHSVLYLVLCLLFVLLVIPLNLILVYWFRLSLSGNLILVFWMVSPLILLGPLVLCMLFFSLLIVIVVLSLWYYRLP